MKRAVLFLLFFSFFLSFFSSAVEAGGRNHRIKKVVGEGAKETIDEEISKPPPTPPPKEFEVVVKEGSIFPSIVNTGYSWSGSVNLTFAVQEKGTNEFRVLPGGTEICFKLYRSTNGGITWDEDNGNGGDIIVYPPNNPYIIPFETKEVIFTGPQIVSKVGNGGISVGGADRYCLGIRIKVKS